MTVLVQPVYIHAATQPSGYRQWVNVKSNELLARADSFNYNGNSDSALVLYTIITSRYYDGLPKDECIATAKAYEGLWNAYFLVYSNLSKAYECIQQEKAILQKCGVERPRLYHELAAFYQTAAVLTHDKLSNKRAMDYHLKAFALALKQNDEEGMTKSLANLITVAYEQNAMNQIRNVWNEYNKYRFKNPDIYVQYNKLMYEGVMALWLGHSKEAANAFENQLKLMTFNGNNIRYRIQTYFFLSQLESKQKNFVSAKAYLEKAEKELSHFPMEDVEVELYDNLYTVCEEMGDSNQALHYRSLYLEAKDDIMNSQMLRSFGQLRFQGEIDKMTQEITTMRNTESRHRMIVVFSIVFAFVMAVMLFYIFRKNRRLASSFRALYEKNVELLNARSELQQKQQSDVESRQSDSHQAKQVQQKEEDPSQEILAASIQSVMSNPDVFCLPSFTVEQLASRVESPYKTVSATIRDVFHCNFNALLNKARIDEACRRINSDSQFRGYTVEGMANSLGYRSRNSFSTAFKRVTGLYPSEYIKEAKVGAE